MIVDVKKIGGAYQYTIDCEIPQVATLFAGFLYSCTGIRNISNTRNIVSFQISNKKLAEDQIRRFTTTNPMIQVRFSGKCSDC